MITRRTTLLSLPFALTAARSLAQDAPLPPVPQPPVTLDTVLGDAAELEPLKVVLVARSGEMLAERALSRSSRR